MNSASPSPPASSSGRRVRRARVVAVLGAALVAAGAVIGLWPPARQAAFQALSQVSAQVGAQQASWRTAPAAALSAAPVLVGVARSISQRVPIYLTAIGTVQAYNAVNLRSRVDGTIVDVRFKEGQFVSAGDLLLLIDPRPYQAQLDQATAQREKDEAMLTQAKLDYERYVTLLKKGFATPQQVEQQDALVSQYSAQVKGDIAQIEYARTQLEFTRITAPISGKIGIRQIDVGNVVHPADPGPMAVITQLQPISAILTLASRSLGQTEIGLGDVTLPVSILSQDENKVLAEGVVEIVDNTVDAGTGTIKLKARFANADMRLWPGDFVNARITVAVRENAVTVPAGAIRHGPRGDYVWLVTPQQKSHVAPVVVGQTFGGTSLVTKGLAAGQNVVTDGYYQLREGTHVTVRAGPASAGQPAEAGQPRHAER